MTARVEAPGGRAAGRKGALDGVTTHHRIAAMIRTGASEGELLAAVPAVDAARTVRGPAAGTKLPVAVT